MLDDGVVVAFVILVNPGAQLFRDFTEGIGPT